jgi:metal-responsive CopG/Arc/MetJ family transcriptional regulator
MVRPVQRVNVDFSSGMLKELDREALELNISRQAVIKTLVRQALDLRAVARQAANQRHG